MLDGRWIRNNPELAKQKLVSRDVSLETIDSFLSLDAKWRQSVSETDTLKQRRNAASEEIGKLKRLNQDTSEKQKEIRTLGEQIKALDIQIAALEEECQKFLLLLPNIPHDTVPIGDAIANKVVHEWGKPKTFSFSPKAHWDIGESLGIIDLARGSKLSGSMFAVYKGWGAKLERALINWMLDFHIQEHGYTEIWPTFLVRREIMTGTGQLPKFEKEMYRCDEDDLFLVPTAEVPVTNLHREEILEGELLPIYYAAYSPCFRREAGAAGKDTRGLLRMHQFNKVELVKFVRPEQSYEEHEKLRRNAEEVLELLEIPYRTVLLASGDMGAAAAKCYDLEAWASGIKTWLEVSSCSNFEDYQARRANIRFRRDPKSKPEFVHTLNASGIALPRTVIAILENYQQDDGSIVVPKVLRPYMNGNEVISCPGR